MRLATNASAVGTRHAFEPPLGRVQQAAPRPSPSLWACHPQICLPEVFVPRMICAALMGNGMCVAPFGGAERMVKLGLRLGESLGLRRD